MRGGVFLARCFSPGISGDPGHRFGGAGWFIDGDAKEENCPNGNEGEVIIAVMESLTMDNFREIPAGGKPFKRIYVALMLWFVGRAIQAAARVDEAVGEEFAALPDGFTFSLGVLPRGPAMIVGKGEEGQVRYRGWRLAGQRIDLQMKIKNLEGALLMFTFQESTAVATARNRLIVDGEVPAACAIVRILDRVEVYLLPKIIAKLAVKRYPDWPWEEKVGNRIRIYAGAILGFR
jgi:hypothetical protein